MPPKLVAKKDKTPGPVPMDPEVDNDDEMEDLESVVGVSDVALAL